MGTFNFTLKVMPSRDVPGVPLANLKLSLKGEFESDEELGELLQDASDACLRFRADGNAKTRWSPSSWQSIRREDFEALVPSMPPVTRIKRRPLVTVSGDELLS